MQETISRQAQAISTLSSRLDAAATETAMVNISVNNLYSTAAMTVDVESNYLLQSTAASTYATQTAVSSTYQTITAANDMDEAMREYTDDLVEVGARASPSSVFSDEFLSPLFIISLVVSSLSNGVHASLALLCCDTNPP